MPDDEREWPHDWPKKPPPRLPGFWDDVAEFVGNLFQFAVVLAAIAWLLWACDKINR